MNIVTWNINSLKARRDHVERFLTESAPDVLMLQELKGADFPEADFKAMGYEAAAMPQKTYNGVAVLSKTPIEVILNKLPGEDSDEQARYLEFETAGTRMINIYAPNGNPVETEKYPYKLRWMDRLFERLKTLCAEQIPFLIGGDFNVIPEPRDCFDPVLWKDDALFRLETRQSFRRFLNLGLTDAFRIYNQEPGQYTFWDYQAGCWPANKGIRIDHFLLSPALTDRTQGCAIDSNPRGWDKPSDHTPVILTLS